MKNSSITREVPPVKFVVIQQYQGPKHVEVPVSLYSKNFLLKAIGIRSHLLMVIDIEKCTIKFVDDKGKEANEKQSMNFIDIESIKLGLKKSHSGCFYLHIKKEDGTKLKIKFNTLSEYQLAVNALRGVETQGGKPLMVVSSKYLKLKESENQDDAEISSEEEDQIEHMPTQKDKNFGGMHEDPEKVLKRQESDEEYAYLKWKFIDRFEKGGSDVPPEQARKFMEEQQINTECPDKHAKVSKQTFPEKTLELPSTIADDRGDQKSYISQGQRTEMSPDLKIQEKVEGFHQIREGDEESPESNKRDKDTTEHKKELHTTHMSKNAIPEEGFSSKSKLEVYNRSG